MSPLAACRLLFERLNCAWQWIYVCAPPCTWLATESAAMLLMPYFACTSSSFCLLGQAEVNLCKCSCISCNCVHVFTCNIGGNQQLMACSASRPRKYQRWLLLTAGSNSLKIFSYFFFFSLLSLAWCSKCIADRLSYANFIWWHIACLKMLFCYIFCHFYFIKTARNDRNVWQSDSLIDSLATCS